MHTIALVLIEKNWETDSNFSLCKTNPSELEEIHLPIPDCLHRSYRNTAKCLGHMEACFLFLGFSYSFQ